MIKKSTFVKDLKNTLLAEGVRLQIPPAERERIALPPLILEGALRVPLQEYAAVHVLIEEDELAEIYEEFLDLFVLPGVLPTSPEKWIAQKLNIPKDNLRHLFGFKMVPFVGMLPTDRINRALLALVLILKESLPKHYHLQVGPNSLFVKGGAYRFGVLNGRLQSNLLYRTDSRLDIDTPIYDLLHGRFGAGGSEPTVFGELIAQQRQQKLKDGLTLLYYMSNNKLPKALSDIATRKLSPSDRLKRAWKFESRPDPLLYLKGELVPTVLGSAEFVKRFGNVYQPRRIEPTADRVEKWKGLLRQYEEQYAE